MNGWNLHFSFMQISEKQNVFFVHLNKYLLSMNRCRALTVPYQFRYRENNGILKKTIIQFMKKINFQVIALIIFYVIYGVSLNFRKLLITRRISYYMR